MIEQIKILINTDFLKEDLRKVGVTCLAAGNAGMFLDLYPGQSSKTFFVMIILFGSLSWFIGLLRRGSK